VASERAKLGLATTLSTNSRASGAAAARTAGIAQVGESGGHRDIASVSRSSTSHPDSGSERSM